MRLRDGEKGCKGRACRGGEGRLGLSRSRVGKGDFGLLRLLPVGERQRNEVTRLLLGS